MIQLGFNYFDMKKARIYGQNKEQVIEIELDRVPQTCSERGFRGIVNALVHVLVQFRSTFFLI